jgi:hypothetical protein
VVNIVAEKIATPVEETWRKEVTASRIPSSHPARSLYERSKEHVRDEESFSESSHIIKHWMKHHPEEGKPEFIFSVI